MQIVIDIPEEIVTDVKDYCGISIADAIKVLPIILNAIHNGTPLPKGHGRLIDADDNKNILIDALVKVPEQEQKIKVLNRDEVARRLGAVDVYQASAWIRFLNNLEYLELKICEVEK